MGRVLNLSCFVDSWLFLHMLHQIFPVEPRCSTRVYRVRQSLRVNVTPGSSVIKSSEVSQNGSTVIDFCLRNPEVELYFSYIFSILVTEIISYPQIIQVTADSSLPKKITSITQLHIPRPSGSWKCKCRASNIAIKNSWASCCSYPAKCEAFPQILNKRSCRLIASFFPL